MLDLIDKKLLFHLDLNCRQSMNELARKLKIHRNVVLYRIKRLEREEIIRGYFSEINTRALGLLTFRVFIKFANSTITQEESLLRFLEQNSNVIWLFRVLGKWDVDFLTVHKTPEEFDQFFRSLRSTFNSLIDLHETSLMTRLFRYPKNYLIGDERKFMGKETFSSTNFSLDSTDKKILQIVSNNANIKLINLAKKSGVSVNTAKSHLKSLQKKGVILGFRPFIDTNKIGHHYYKMHINLKQYAHSDYLRINEFIGLLPETIYIIKYIQGADIETELQCKDENDLLRIVNEIKELFGEHIQDLYTLKFYKEYVYRYFPDGL